MWVVDFFFFCTRYIVSTRCECSLLYSFFDSFRRIHFFPSRRGTTAVLYAYARIQCITVHHICPNISTARPLRIHPSYCWLCGFPFVWPTFQLFWSFNFMQTNCVLFMWNNHTYDMCMTCVRCAYLPKIEIDFGQSWLMHQTIMFTVSGFHNFIVFISWRFDHVPDIIQFHLTSINLPRVRRFVHIRSSYTQKSV